MSSVTKSGKKKSKGRSKAQRVPVEDPTPTDLRFMSHKTRTTLRARALALFEECGNKTQVAEEFGVNRETVTKWVKEAGLEVKKGSLAPPPPPNPEDFMDDDGEIIPTDEGETMGEEEQAQFNADREMISKLSEQEKTDIIRIGMLLARDREMEIIEAAADGEQTPAQRYQTYAANFGMRMLRDNKSKIRGPRTVKELAELDAFIRRNLGLDAKGGGRGGGGGGALHVDVKILNQGPLPPSEINKGPAVEVEARPA